MYECVKKNIPFVLAGSIRDDGPLPDVITDVMEAQDAMRKQIEGCSMVLMIATLLHSIAVGNCLPSSVKTVCVDINPAHLTKLMDRGTTQAIGIVSDAGTFLPLLAKQLEIQNCACQENNFFTASAAYSTAFRYREQIPTPVCNHRGYPAMHR